MGGVGVVVSDHFKAAVKREADDGVGGDVGAESKGDGECGVVGKFDISVVADKSGKFAVVGGGGMFVGDGAR